MQNETRRTTSEAPTHENVARKFSELLLAELGRETLLKIVHENMSEENPEICHSHDFCDANEVMNDALEWFDFELYSDSGLNQETEKVFSAAWKIAKANNFFLPA